MQKTIEIDFLSDDERVRQNSVRWLKQEYERPAKHEGMKQLVADLRKPKTLSAIAGRQLAQALTWCTWMPFFGLCPSTRVILSK